MINTFPIEFVRHLILQKLYEEKLKNVHFVGGTNEIDIASFYEQLATQEQVDRFIKLHDGDYRDITDQQNRVGLIANGVIIAPENPTITNIYSSTIIPLSWVSSLRVKIKNRDSVIETINNLTEVVKGRKFDVAELKTRDMNGGTIYVPFVVGTIGNRVGTLTIENGDFIGSYTYSDVLDTKVTTLLSNLGVALGTYTNWLYIEYIKQTGEHILQVIQKNTETNKWVVIEDDGSFDDVIFPVDHEDFTKYKMSVSLESIRCDEPRTLNTEEYCDITFGGSATITSKGVALGNDLLKIIVSKKKIMAQTPIEFGVEAPQYYLEPLELPSSNDANTKINQLTSNLFVNNSHTDALNISPQYSFVLDRDNVFIDQLFKYARYGTQGITVNDISPNMIFEITEIWCSWGVFEKNSFLGKIVDSIDIENTESDTMSISVQFQVQGANN